MEKEWAPSTRRRLKRKNLQESTHRFVVTTNPAARERKTDQQELLLKAIKDNLQKLLADQERKNCWQVLDHHDQQWAETAKLPDIIVKTSKSSANYRQV